ncbi:MAG TPA: discoidin domain-containing protein [Polyangiaceae bacterium]
MKPDESSVAGVDAGQSTAARDAQGSGPPSPFVPELGDGGDTLARVPPAPQKRSRARRLIDFFWRGPEITAARAALARRSASEKRLLAYARGSAELADRTLNPVDPLRASSGIPIAVALYREAFRAARSAQGAEGPASPTDFAALTGDELEVARARDLLLAPDLQTEIAEGREIRREHVRRLQQSVRELLNTLALPEQRVRRVRLQRWVRIGVPLVALLGVIVAAVVAIMVALQPPNLLAGKPWRASSSIPNFSAATREIDGQKVEIFFHTTEEQSPWIEYDLGKPTRISGLRIVNRGDCCADRATPIVLEASDDRTTWKPMLRRDEPFTTWRQTLPSFTARYVRLRVDKQSWLHLEKFELR